MNEVIQLSDHKPHITGPCLCGYCGHKWVGVIPVPLDKDQGYECPECHRMFGFLEYPIGGAMGEEQYICNKCNGSFFAVHRDSIVCCICGTRHLNVLEQLETSK